MNTEDVSGYLQMVREANENEFEKKEFCAVGTGIGGSFTHTTELKVLKFDEAVNGPDKKNCYKAIEEVYERFMKNDCYEEVPIEEVNQEKRLSHLHWR